jgi:hypothetical protein
MMTGKSFVTLGPLLFIRLDCKWLVATNALAYNGLVIINARKSCVVNAPVIEKIRFQKLILSKFSNGIKLFVTLSTKPFCLNIKSRVLQASITPFRPPPYTQR